MFITKVISFGTKSEEKNFDYCCVGNSFSCVWGDIFFK